MKPTMTLKKYAAFALLCIVTLGGCTSIIKPPDEPYAKYAQQEKINLSIGLNITNELRQAKWESGPWIMPVGASIAQNAEPLAQHVFKYVVKANETEKQNQHVDAVLTPKFAYANRTLGATSHGKSIVSVKVEWNLTTPDGKLIWVDTVGGESSGSSGWTNPETLLRQALEELWRNSQQTMASSGVIKRFAAVR